MGSTLVLASSMALLFSLGHPSTADCSAGCLLSHQTLGTTNFVVTVVWGAGSEAGTCTESQQVPGACLITKNCKFGAYVVKVSGTGMRQWRDRETGEFAKATKLDGEDSGFYGDAAEPIERLCGDGTVQVYFPDDLAGGGPVCTSCY